MLVLITIGIIAGPIGAVLIEYRDNLSQVVVTPQIKQLIHSGNNNNSNNNNNNNNNSGNNNNNNSNNNNGNSLSNSGNVNSNNPDVNSPTNSFGSSGQFAVTAQSNGNQVSGQFAANIDCFVQENGNNVLISLDLYPQSVPNDLQLIFSTNNDYVFNFAGTTSNSSSGMQITASDQGSLNPGGAFNINLSGSIGQGQGSFTFSLTSAGNSQASISTVQAINAYPNNNNGNSNNGGNNNSNGNGNNNNNSNVNLDNAASQINTATGKITLVFTITNSNSQSETISKMSATVMNNQDQVTLGTISLQSSATIPAGQSSQVTVSGALTSQGKADLEGATSVDIEVANGSITVNGVSQSQSQPQDFGNISVVS